MSPLVVERSAGETADVRGAGDDHRHSGGGLVQFAADHGREQPPRCAAAAARYCAAVAETTRPKLEEWRFQLDPMLAGLQDFAVGPDDPLDGSGESLRQVE